MPDAGATKTTAIIEGTGGEVGITVEAVPFYKRWHIGGSYALGIVAVCGVVATMTGPPSFISKEVWETVTFASIIISTFFKGIQSANGSTAIALPQNKKE